MKTTRKSSKSRPQPRRTAAASTAPARRLRAKLVKIGNSRGVRLPQAVIQASGLPDEVELVIGEGKVTLQAPENPRAGWEEAFARAIAEHGPPELTEEDREWLDAPLDQPLDGSTPPDDDWDGQW